MPPSDVSIGLREIVCHFNELQDPRSTINRLHPLPSVLTIALMGVLTGAKGPTGIAKWAVAKKELLLQGLDLPNGIPSRDVIRRVLSAVKVDAFQSCVATEEKSNEITAIPELMRLIDLKGAIIGLEDDWCRCVSERR